jgi:hypothetical protein
MRATRERKGVGLWWLGPTEGKGEGAASWAKRPKRRRGREPVRAFGPKTGSEGFLFYFFFSFISKPFSNSFQKHLKSFFRFSQSHSV